MTEQNKGSLSRFIQVEMPGGMTSHLGAGVEEVPAFSPGEEAGLFPGSAKRRLSDCRLDSSGQGPLAGHS